jgi:hypothetical protein
MARSHHRKKHKEHVKQFKNSHDTAVSASAAKSRASGKWVFALAGAVAGFVASYLATDGSFPWMAIATVVAGTVGYYAGMRIDASKG